MSFGRRTVRAFMKGANDPKKPTQIADLNVGELVPTTRDRIIGANTEMGEAFYGLASARKVRRPPEKDLVKLRKWYNKYQAGGRDSNWAMNKLDSYVSRKYGGKDGWHDVEDMMLRYMKSNAE